MNFALPLVVVTCVAGVQAARRKRRPGFDANLTPAEKRQLDFDGQVALIATLIMAAHESSVYHRLGGLDNLQIVLVPLPGEVGPARRRCGRRTGLCQRLPHQHACLHKPSA